MNKSEKKPEIWHPRHRGDSSPGELPEFLDPQRPGRSVAPMSFDPTPEEECHPETEPQCIQPASESEPEEQPEPSASLSPLLAVGTLLDRIRRESRSLITDLSIRIAKRILQKAISEDPDWVVQNAEACLEHSLPNGQIKMRLNPEDKKRIQDSQPTPAWASSSDESIVLVADPDLEPGDCVLESERARVDGRSEAQLEQLRCVLEDAVAGALFQTDA